MHLGRFHAVIYDLAQHFQRAALPAKLEQAAALLDQYAASRTPPQLEAFRASVDALYTAAVVDDPDLQQPYAQQVISELSLDVVLPPKLNSAIARIIADKSFDPAGLSAELRQLATTATKKISQVVSIDAGFTGLSVEFERVEGASAEVGFLLPREVVGDTLKDLTSEFAQLGKLVRAVNELVGADNYDPRVVTISSSWWQVFLDLDPNQILVWVLAIERIANLFKSNLEIKNLQKQLGEREMPREITDMIEKEVQKRVGAAIRDLASEIRRDHSKVDDEARMNEVENQLRQGLFYLAKRMNQGAQVEINVGIPEAPDEPKASAEGEEPSTELMSQIAQAKERIAQLRDLRTRARSASAETISIDHSAPLLLTGDTHQEDAKEGSNSSSDA